MKKWFFEYHPYGPNSKMPIELLDYYTCQVQYVEGWKTHSKDFSVNVPHPELGRPIMIVIKPADDQRPVVRVEIPENTMPVFFKRRQHNAGDMDYLEELSVACGWRMGSTKVLHMVNMRTGKKSTVLENDRVKE